MPSRAKNGSILVVDDEVSVCETVRLILEPEGYVIRVAHDGISGLNSLVASQPDLILCDIKLPGLNGFEMIVQARQRLPALQRVPFVMLSGLDDEMTVRAGYKIGASDFLRKPFKAAQLRSAIATLLTGTKMDAVPLNAGADGEKKQRIVVDPSFTTPLANDASPGSSKTKPRPGSPTKLHAQVQLMSLQEVIEELGDQWPKIRDKAMMIAEGVIRKSLEHGDTFSRTGDTNFNIVFRDTKEDRARRRIEVIEMNIRQRLLGGGNEVAHSVDVSGAITPSPSRAAESDSKHRAGQIDDGPTGTRSGLLSRRDQDDADGSAVLIRPDTDWIRRQISVVYRPVWCAESKAVVAYQAHLVRKTRYGNYEGGRVLHGGATDPEAFDLDVMVVSTIIDEAAKLPPAADAAMIGVPIHFSSLRADFRDHLGEVLAAAPPEVLQKLILEIGELPDIRGEMTIRWGIHFLRQFCETLSVKVMPNDRHARLFAQNGVAVFQFDLNEFPDGYTRENRAAFIKSFVNGSRQLGVQTRIDGLNVIDEFRVARSSKVDFACGPTIGWMIESPRQIYPLDEMQILGL